MARAMRSARGPGLGGGNCRWAAVDARRCERERLRDDTVAAIDRLAERIATDVTEA